jgi:NitT/TauT family transport system permease protein
MGRATRPLMAGRGRHGGWLYPTVTVGVVLAVWELAARLGWVPRYLLPSVSGILGRTVELRTLVAKELMVTLWEILLGFGLSVIVGVPLGFALVSWRAFHQAVYPLLIGSQVVPKVAVAPLFLLWFGFGVTAKVLITFLVAFFPIVINSAVGLGSIESGKLDVARAAGATPLQLFRLVRLPNALPTIFGGMKVSITLAVVGALVAEFIAAENGIGRLLLNANGNMDTELLFGGILALVGLGVALYLAMEAIERLLLPWHMAQRLQPGARLGPDA